MSNYANLPRPGRVESLLTDVWYFFVDRWWALWAGFSALWSERRRDTIIVSCMLADDMERDGVAHFIKLLYGADGRYGGAVAGELTEKGDEQAWRFLRPVVGPGAKLVSWDASRPPQEGETR